MGHLIFLVFPLLLSCLLTTKSAAQHHISFNGGIGIPTGDYASEDLTKSGSGYAEPGFHMSGDYTNIIFNRVGLKASVSYGQNPLNGQFLLNALKSNYDFIVTQEETTDRSYQHWAVMVGPSLAYEVGKVIFHFNVSGGYLNTSYPGIRLDLRGTDGFNQYMVTSKQDKANSGGFCFKINGGFNYNLNSSFFLNFDLNFITSGQEFNTMTSSQETTLTNNQTNTYQVQRPTVFDIGVNRFLITTGIGLNLN